MKITRRSFLKSIAALAISAAIPIPALSKDRNPYVKLDDVVSYIGPAGQDGFCGGRSIKSIGKWDGAGYPVTTRTSTYPAQEEIFYDVDLADFNRDVPKHFWHNPAHKIYPNVHTYVRSKRYGESVEQAIKKLNYASSERFLETYFGLMRKAA